MADVTLAPVADTYLNSNNVLGPATDDTNYSTESVLLVGMAFTATFFSRRGLLDFDLSSVTRSAKNAILSMTVAGDFGGAGNGETPSLYARRVIRPAVITEATYNRYDAGNLWGSSGARSIGGDVSSLDAVGDVMLSNVSGTVYTVDVADLLNESLSDASNRLLLILTADSFTADNNPVGFASIEHSTTGWRPVLDITYRSPWTVGRGLWGDGIGAWH